MGRNSISARSTGTQWLLSVGKTPLIRVDTRAEAEESGRRLAEVLGIGFETTNGLD
ncbi:MULTISPECIES: hypothetical protein [unclassified Curtobacterium]|uniref:hypothetical protein n=1 Tax=unclassified Curtobacterium TaxID=257496 RepID=UPI0015E8E9F1|nr:MULTISPECIES: hypothetical protein [unclassified Curtobacterium]